MDVRTVSEAIVEAERFLKVARFAEVSWQLQATVKAVFGDKR